MALGTSGRNSAAPVCVAYVADDVYVSDVYFTQLRRI